MLLSSRKSKGSTDLLRQVSGHLDEVDKSTCGDSDEAAEAVNIL
jgi:hypothetical protein